MTRVRRPLPGDSTLYLVSLLCCLRALPGCSSDDTQNSYGSYKGLSGAGGAAGAGGAGGAAGGLFGGGAGSPQAGSGGASGGGSTAGGGGPGGSGGAAQGGSGPGGAAQGGSGPGGGGAAQGGAGSSQGGKGGAALAGQGGTGGQGGCQAASDCPGTDTACRVRVCDAGLCSMANVATDSPCTGGGSYCDGAGTCVNCTKSAQCASDLVCTNHQCVGSLPCQGNAHLLISQIRTHGLAGGGDEFVELHNPTSAPIELDSTWELQSRAATSAGFTKRWGGNLQTVPAHGYFLMTGSTYTQSPAQDAPLQSGIKDSGSVLLVHGGTTIDALCFYSDAVNLSLFDATFLCEGMPVSNAPHDDSTSAAANVDQSLSRHTGSSCLDSGDNATDFSPLEPAAPHSLSSP